MVPGVLVTVAVAASVQYTSLVLWRFCLKHPEIRDVCDIGRMLFGGSQLAYNITAVFFVLNNTFIQALHCLVGAKLLNTLSDGAACTVAFSAIAAFMCFFVSLPRQLSQLSALGTFAAVTQGLAVLLAIIFAGIQKHPAGYVAGSEPIVTLWPVAGTTYVAGMSAFLNIFYTFVGQITLPSFIAEMENPKDFPKGACLRSVRSHCSGLTPAQHSGPSRSRRSSSSRSAGRSCTTSSVRRPPFPPPPLRADIFTGNQYMTAPAFGSLIDPYKKIAFAFAIPTIIFLGALYSSVTTRFVFFRLFADSRHKHSNTAVGWAAWVGIAAATWTAAFVIAEVIPFFSDMLSLMSSLFDGWFGCVPRHESSKERG
jgi:hypothetical protein